MPITSFKVRISACAAALTLISPLGRTALHAAPASLKATISTPKPGSRERQELMDALRGPFQKQYHQAVVFKVNRLKVGSGYAYLDATALGADSKPAHALAEMGGSVSAFYRKQNGHWYVVKWGSYGGMDLIDECRHKYPKAPRALFL